MRLRLAVFAAAIVPSFFLLIRSGHVSVRSKTRTNRGRGQEFAAKAVAKVLIRHAGMG
jgi:hypothetical protein